MEKQLNTIKPADARIVQAVRKLKSSKIVDQIEVCKNLDETKQSKNVIKPVNIDETLNKQKKAKKALTPITQATKTNSTNNNITNNNITNNNINNNNNLYNNLKTNIIKKDISKVSSKTKISIDGGTLKPNTGSTNKTSKTFDYETLKKYKKRKISDFQKNLLSKKSLEKYKEECVNLINKDAEIKTLLEQIGINKNEDYLIYINDNFFIKPHFLFTLEILILEAVEEANTLKVFRTNKNVLPLKVVKENYYRDEIIKDLKLKIYGDEYDNKFKNLLKNIDSFIDDLKKSEL